MEHTVADAVSIFYKLKGRYDKEGQKLKQKILNRVDLSLEEKREMYQAQKRKCINCKKPVGTIFKVEAKRYIAMCGARENPDGGVTPCNLDIQISRGIVELLPNYVEELREKHKELITSIMKIKFNLLFKYSNEEETVTTFETTKNEFDANATLFDANKTKLVEITNLLEKREKIDLTDLQIFEFVKEIKALVEDAHQSGNPQLLKDAVEIYIQKMLDVLQENRGLKYSYQAIESDGEKRRLVQKPYTLQSLETVVDCKFKVDALKIK